MCRLNAEHLVPTLWCACCAPWDDEPTLDTSPLVISLATTHDDELEIPVHDEEWLQVIMPEVVWCSANYEWQFYDAFSHIGPAFMLSPGHELDVCGYNYTVSKILARVEEYTDCD